MTQQQSLLSAILQGVKDIILLKFINSGAIAPLFISLLQGNLFLHHGVTSWEAISSWNWIAH
jgi:hypothetical protein